MTDLTSFFKTDRFNDHVADDVNELIAAALRAEFANTETISATKELTDNDCQFQIVTASGADRTVELAPEGTSNHITIIYNAGASNNVVVKDDSGTSTLATLAADEWAMFVPVGGEGWKALSPSSGADGVGDVLSTLAQSEVSVTGAVALDATAFGKMHYVSGTAAAYTITLPAVSGNGSKFIGFRFVSGLTKIVTLDGNSSEKIGPDLTRVYVHDENVILQCNGTSWNIISENMLPVEVDAYLNTPFAVADVTETEFIYDVEVTDSEGAYNPATGRFTPLVPGLYEIIYSVSLGSTIADGKQLIIGYFFNTFTDGNMFNVDKVIPGGATASTYISRSFRIRLNGSTDAISMGVRHNNGGSVNSYPQAGVRLQIVRLSR